MVLIVVVMDVVPELVAVLVGVVDVVADVVAELVTVLVGVVDVVNDDVIVVDGVDVWHRSIDPSCTPAIAVLSELTSPLVQLAASAAPGTMSTPLWMHPRCASFSSYTTGSTPCSSELSAPATVGHALGSVAASSTRVATTAQPIAGCVSDESHSAAASLSSRAWAWHRSLANCSPSFPISKPMYPSPPATSHSRLASASVVVTVLVPVVVEEVVPVDVAVVDVVGVVVNDDVGEVVTVDVTVLVGDDVGDVDVVGDVVGDDVADDVTDEVGDDVADDVGVVEVVGVVVAELDTDVVAELVTELVGDVDGVVDVVWVVVGDDVGDDVAVDVPDVVTVVVGVVLVVGVVVGDDVPVDVLVLVGLVVCDVVGVLITQPVLNSPARCLFTAPLSSATV